MSKIENVLATAKAHTTISRSVGRLDSKLSSPDAGASAYDFEAIQLHPTAEQFFAGAWSACFITVLEGIAKAKKVVLPTDLAVEVEVDIGTAGGGYQLQARFNVNLPGVPQDVAEALARAAHEHCPYSKATRGNIDVTLNVVTA
jgi:osmotically inducible protein OsmC